MSNFAERLIARAAGQQLGTQLSFLTPRSAARFDLQPLEIAAEATAGHMLTQPLDIEAGATAGHMLTQPLDIEAGATAGHMLTQPLDAADMPTGPLIDRAGKERRLPENVETTGALLDPSVRTPLRQANAVSPTPRLEESQLPAARPMRPAAVSLPDSVKPEIERIAPTTDFTPRVQSRSMRRSHEPRESKMPPLVREERAMRDEPSPKRDRATAQERGAHGFGRTNVGSEVGPDGAPSQAPQVSIGKIEVQFLPQESRLPTPPPTPQRTRGFEAYARARRGEPR